MPLQALRTVAKSQNGVGAFILQCKRLDFHYCDWAGSSKGMNRFLQHNLPAFARANPSIEIHVSPRPNTHPVIRAHYINNKNKAICVRNLEKEQILQKAVILRDGNGEKNRKVTGGRIVKSLNESVRGIWSPMHGAPGPLVGMSKKG